jgi:hypothetical protein
MRVLVHSTFAQTEGRTVLDLFTSCKTPRRPADAREVASFTYGDDRGVHVLFFFDVDNARLAEFLEAQAARTSYMTARADVKIVVHVGYPVEDALAIATAYHPVS